MAKRKKKEEKPVVLDPNQIKVRDYLMLLIIQGITKAGTQKDRKKEKSKKACRGKVKTDD